MGKSVFSAPKKAVDPTLDALFASSVGPVAATAKPKYEPLVAAKPRAAPKAAPIKPLSKEEEEATPSEDEQEDDEEDDDEEEDDEDDDEDDSEEDEEADSSDASEEETPAEAVDLKSNASKRKRKNRDENDDLESRYFDKLEKEIDGPAEKKAKRTADNSDEEMADSNDDENESDEEPIIHESLLKSATNGDAEDVTADGPIGEEDKAKADRTVFLSNVSISAVTGKAAKKTLVAHLESILDSVKKSKADKEKDGEDGEEKKDDKPTLESLRFRSVPFASAALPKRASFITKNVMSATAQSTNAYAVYSTAAAARTAVRKLNGTVVLDRHLRADSVSHPSPVDHKRCVFVGNLGFVDDETVLSANPDDEGGETRKKRNKTPMDVEEGLWRTFGKHAGKVESVRVIRDQVTRVGKGFAYVQFYDATTVEAALLLNEKKYPPLLPRALRVSRCKAPYKTARAVERAQRKVEGKPEQGARDNKRDRKNDRRDRTTGYTPKLTAEQQTSAGRASKLLGKSKSAATTPLGTTGPDGKPMVFEGMRARVGGVNLFKKGKKKGPRNSGPPGSDASRKQVRQAGRAANWRAKQGGGA